MKAPLTAIATAALIVACLALMAALLLCVVELLFLREDLLLPVFVLWGSL